MMHCLVELCEIEYNGLSDFEDSKVMWICLLDSWCSWKMKNGTMTEILKVTTTFQCFQHIFADLLVKYEQNVLVFSAYIYLDL